MDTLDLNTEQKLDILKVVFQEMHTQRRTAAALENKVAFAFGALLLAFAALILKGDVSLESEAAFIATLSIIMVTIIAVWFLLRNGNLIRVECRMLVRIEQIFGLYEQGRYISPESVEIFNNHPYPEATVFPNQVLAWGTSDKWQTVTPHTIGVIAAAITALLAIGVK